MNMNTILWIAQIILAIKFLSAAFSHAFQQDKASMRYAIQKVGSSAKPILSLFAVLMLIGAVGIILPAISGSIAWLAPVSAAGLAVMNIVSILLHQKFREKPLPFVGIILFVISAFVAYGRWVISPL
jgi:hypothetical protein